MPTPITRRLRRGAALPAALALTIALGACGHDEPDTAPPPTDDEAAPSTTADEATPAPDDYLAEVNAICTAGNEQLDALAAEGFADGAEPTQDQRLEVLDQLVDVIVEQLDDIEALEPPDDVARDVEAWLSDARATADDVRASGTTFFDQQANGENPFAEVSSAAIELGFDACGT